MTFIDNQSVEAHPLSHYRHLNIPGGDMRISITAKCNMRCSYCHNEGQGAFTGKYMPIDVLLSIVRLGLKYGINKVRLTGGEPLLHPRIYDIVRALKNDLAIQDVGVNTNGILLTKENADKLKNAGVDVVVVGLDYYDSKISKDSSRGSTSSSILDNIIRAQQMGINVQIASVYSVNDICNTRKIVEWCRDNRMLLKVLEVSDEDVSPSTSSEFLHLISILQNEYSLTLGKTVAFNETFGVHSNGTRILFFHSHCRVRECHECSLMHMRVTATGCAKPCILRKDTEFSLIGEDPDLSLRKAIHNLGNPPEKQPR